MKYRITSRTMHDSMTVRLFPGSFINCNVAPKARNSFFPQGDMHGSLNMQQIDELDHGKHPTSNVAKSMLSFSLACD